MAKRVSLASSVKPSKIDESMRPLAENTKPDLTALFEETPSVPFSKEPKSGGRRYEGKKTMLIPLDPAIHRKLKMLAVEKDMTLEKVVQRAIELYVSKDQSN